MQRPGDAPQAVHQAVRDDGRIEASGRRHEQRTEACAQRDPARRARSDIYFRTCSPSLLYLTFRRTMRRTQLVEARRT